MLRNMRYLKPFCTTIFVDVFTLTFNFGQKATGSYVSHTKAFNEIIVAVFVEWSSGATLLYYF